MYCFIFLLVGFCKCWLSMTPNRCISGNSILASICQCILQHYCSLKCGESYLVMSWHWYIEWRWQNRFLNAGILRWSVYKFLHYVLNDKLIGQQNISGVLSLLYFLMKNFASQVTSVHSARVRCNQLLINPKAQKSLVANWYGKLDKNTFNIVNYSTATMWSLRLLFHNACTLAPPYNVKKEIT